MKLHQIAIAAATLSLAGATVAAGNDATSSSPGTAPHSSMSTPSASTSPPSSDQSYSASPSAASDRSDPTFVRSVQQALKDKGFDVGAIDGQMGPATEGALRKFQQSQNLPESGSLDQQTLSALGVHDTAGAASSAATQGPASSTQGAMQNRDRMQDQARAPGNTGASTK